MVPCVILGDSIAVGVGQYRPECVTIARSGISSARYVAYMLAAQDAESVVISLGVNDDARIDTTANLRRVRSEIRAQNVYWLLPGIKERARAAIRDVAAEFGDRLIDTRDYAGRDHLHPSGSGYIALAGLTESGAAAEPAVASYDAEPSALSIAGGHDEVLFRHSFARYRHLASFVQWGSSASSGESRWLALRRTYYRDHHRLALVHASARSHGLFASVARYATVGLARPVRSVRHFAHRTWRHMAQPAIYARAITCARKACFVLFRPERG